MKKLFTTLILLTPLFVAAENYFVEGAKWTYYNVNHSIPTIYSIEGTDFKAGYECHNLYSNLFLGAEKTIITLIRTEGDKVYYLHDPDATEWDLLYDFGLEEGEVCEISWLYEILYSNWYKREDAIKEGLSVDGFFGLAKN